MLRFSRAVALIAALLTLCVATSAGAQLPSLANQATGRLEGVVWDSTRVSPLSGSVVQLVRADAQSAPRSTTADDKGRFRIDSLIPGVWVVAVLHPRLDSLALEDLAQPVDVKARGTTRMTIGVPSAGTLSEQLCRADRNDSTGYLTGRLRRAEGARDGTAGTVRVEWVQLTIADSRLNRQIVAADAQAAPTGHFRVCGIPGGAATRVRAWSEGDTTGAIDVEFPASGITRLDLLVGRTTYIRQLIDSTAAPDDTLATTTVRVGNGRLVGIVLNAVGQPVANATVLVAGNGRTQLTSDSGRFDLQSLPTGTQLLDVRAIGFAPLRAPVDIVPGETSVSTFTLPQVTKLAAIEVRAARAALMGQDMIDFEARRRRGFGRFFGPDDLIALDPLRLGSLVQRVAGVKVVQDGISGDRILMSGSGFSMYCSPDIWLDGFRVVNDGTMDSFIQPQQLRAVEVYVRASGVPPQYTSSNLCGAIVLWSGPREVPGQKKR